MLWRSKLCCNHEQMHCIIFSFHCYFQFVLLLFSFVLLLLKFVLVNNIIYLLIFHLLMYYYYILYLMLTLKLLFKRGIGFVMTYQLISKSQFLEHHHICVKKLAFQCLTRIWYFCNGNIRLIYYCLC